MQILSKTYNELTKQELYELLQLRSEVFVVEQNCAYQDVDGKDQIALHVLIYNNHELIGYSRAFKPGDYFKESSIGRVVVKDNQRAHKIGYKIMEATIQAIQQHFNETTIKISAQTHLKSFYNNLGFNEIGEEYLEDDIPHIAMIRT